MKKLLHFDSINASQIQSNTIYSKTIYNVSWRLPHPISKVKSISLKSVEMPLLFGNVRYYNNNDSEFHFTVKYNNTNLSFKYDNVEEPYFTSIVSLLSDLNTFISNQISIYFMVGNPNNKFVLTFNVDSNNMIYIQSTKITSITFYKSTLFNTILNFQEGTYSLSSTVYSSTIYNLYYDTYLNFHIYNLPVENTNVNDTLSTFKLPLVDSIYQDILFYNSNDNKYIQKIEITNDRFILDSLFVHIYDKFGKEINPNNTAHYSFTLEIETSE